MHPSIHGKYRTFSSFLSKLDFLAKNWKMAKKSGFDKNSKNVVYFPFMDGFCWDCSQSAQCLWYMRFFIKAQKKVEKKLQNFRFWKKSFFSIFDPFWSLFSGYLRHLMINRYSQWKIFIMALQDTKHYILHNS